jgi:hypothetical protein
MTLRIEQNEDGTLHYISDGHVVVTGPDTTGVVTTADGTEYNVAPHVLEVASPEHAAEVAALIEKGV